MSDHQLIELDYDPLEYLDEGGMAQMVSQKGIDSQQVDAEMAATLELHEALSGCFKIVGPIAICYSRDGAGFKVCLRLAGIEVTCVNINASRPCAKLEGNVLLAKASIQVCLQGKCLTYKAQACYRTTPFSKWKCVSKSGKIICF